MEQELQKEQNCSFYALEQLRQTAEAILRGSQRLLKCRAGVEKYRIGCFVCRISCAQPNQKQQRLGAFAEGGTDGRL